MMLALEFLVNSQVCWTDKWVEIDRSFYHLDSTYDEVMDNYICSYWNYLSETANYNYLSEVIS
jgi:hypothetical protein